MIKFLKNIYPMNLKRFLSLDNLTKIVLTLILLSLSQSSFSSEKIMNIIIYEGDTLKLDTNPLRYRPDIDSIENQMPRIDFVELRKIRGCYSGYQSEWIIIDNKLYLTNIYSCNYLKDSIKFNMEQLFEEEYKNGMVKATWVSGMYLGLGGDPLDKRESIYKQEILFRLRQGVIVGVTRYPESFVHESIFDNIDTLNNYVYKNINWKIIPNFENLRINISVYIGNDKYGKPSIIKIRDNYNSITHIDNSKVKKDNTYSGLRTLEKEITRVLNTLPDWSIYKIKGEIENREKYLNFYFDETKRKQYSQ